MMNTTQKVKNYSKHIFLGLSILAFVSTLLYYFYFERGALGAFDQTYLSTVKSRVKEELLISQKEMGQVAERLTSAREYTFNGLSIKTNYPYYILRNKQLIFWSDHLFVPDFLKLSNLYEATFINFSQGQYIINRRQLIIKNDTIDIFSSISLYRKYKIENNYLESKYNKDLFATDPLSISGKKSSAYEAIEDEKGKFLFSVQPPKIEVYRNQNLPVNTVFLSLLTVLFFGLYVFSLIKYFNQKRNFEISFIILAAYLVLLRRGMLYLNVPTLLSETDLFNPKFYYSSFINPTLGDLLLNCVVVLILALFLVDYYYRTKTYFLFTRSSKVLKIAVSVIGVALSFWVFYGYYSIISSIYKESSYELDITLSLAFSGLKWACILIFIGSSSIYFLFIHLISNLFIRSNQKYQLSLVIFGIGVVLGLASLWIAGIVFDWIVIAHCLYFLVLVFARFPRILYAFRYKTSIYYFLAAFFCSVVGTYIVYEQEELKDSQLKKRYGKKIIPANDETGEFFLNRANESIRQDRELQNKFITAKPFLRSNIQEKIRSEHLDMYFDKYNIEISSFTSSGQPIESLSSDSTFQTYAKSSRKPQYATAYQDVYFINDTLNNFGTEYVNLIDIKQDSAIVGHVILSLKLRKDSPKSVYPEYLMDKNFVPAPETRQYGYAIYDIRNKLLFSSGSYNYERKMPVAVLNDRDLYDKGLIQNEFKHVGEKGKNGRKAVVSSKSYSWKSLISNFSFLYLILVLYIIFIIIVYAVNYGFSKLKINYTTRIQILLNIAFFLPLALVVVIMLSVISTNYVNNQEATYLANTKNAAANFLPYMEESIAGKRSDAALQQELAKIGKDADVDINFFDTKGILFSTTRREIYEYGLLSRYLNPEAYTHLLEDKENEILLTESLGNNQYRTAYVAVKSANGKQLGVLGVPYFGSKPELDQQILEVISSVLSVFAIMFLLFLILSYWASNILTVPLRLLTQKIRKINLYQLNQPLEWKSDDEIGAMIGAYNQMLTKLEESKQELAKSEKMTAWREMAKQVAHEIKNPLTPMKLTIQQLQRTMMVRELPNGERIQRTFDTLIDQIDNISDIATSFSDFAKMPLPKNELFEITSVLDKAAALYADDDKITLRREIQQGDIEVMGDRQLTGRIITNLIINGIQSVPTYRRPEITLKLHTDNSKVYIEVKDNGGGIPEGIRNKVFLPNFSTKQDGSGLGLAIAKRGVEHANGTIWFETEESVGTSFFMSWPISS